ncbi:TetR/AcrR family transcriptional regulator [Jiangella alkaliphila]|uniref:TetR/AcrR family transcriptional regulator n=1 Tax=Jiangella alkaliphila TaxID=419479 RepID=UPI00069B3CF3|nr:TetR-like C-terminal domain-containing protein [Jiangella alkaliphila]
MPRAGLTTAGVVDHALAVVDQQGVGGLTLAAVAGRAGVATPSLYKHVRGLPELRTLLGIRVLEEMADRFAAAVMGRSTDDAVAALLREYRAYATEYPARYATLPFDPLHNPGQVTAGTRLMNVFLAVMRGYDLQGSDAVHATRRCRAVAHGFVDIEVAGGFGLPEDLDETYEQLITMLVMSLRAQTRSTVTLPGNSRSANLPMA